MIATLRVIQNSPPEISRSLSVEPGSHRCERAVSEKYSIIRHFRWRVCAYTAAIFQRLLTEPKIEGVAAAAADVNTLVRDIL
jgi:hypothetical protein